MDQEERKLRLGKKSRKQSNRRSSILKLTKSPARNVLCDLDPNNASDGDEETTKRRKSRRVSFAETRFVREFHDPALHALGKDHQPQTDNIKGFDNLLTGTIQTGPPSGVTASAAAPSLPNATMIGNISMDLTMCQDNRSFSVQPTNPSVESRSFLSGLITNQNLNTSASTTRYFKDDEMNDMELTGVNRLEPNHMTGGTSSMNFTGGLDSTSRYAGWDTTETKVYEPDENPLDACNKTRVFLGDDTGKMDFTTMCSPNMSTANANVFDSTRIFKSGDGDMDLTQCVQVESSARKAPSYNTSQFGPEHMQSPVAKVQARSFLDKLMGIDKAPRLTTDTPSPVFDIGLNKERETPQQKVDAFSFLQKLKSNAAPAPDIIGQNSSPFERTRTFSAGSDNMELTETLQTRPAADATCVQPLDMDLTKVTPANAYASEKTKIFGEEETGAMDFTTCTGAINTGTTLTLQNLKDQYNITGGEKTINFLDMTGAGNMSMTTCVSPAMAIEVENQHQNSHQVSSDPSPATGTATVNEANSRSHLVETLENTKRTGSAVQTVHETHYEITRDFVEVMSNTSKSFGNNACENKTINFNTSSVAADMEMTTCSQHITTSASNTKVQYGEKTINFNASTISAEMEITMCNQTKPVTPCTQDLKSNRTVFFGDDGSMDLTTVNDQINLTQGPQRDIEPIPTVPLAKPDAACEKQNLTSVIASPIITPEEEPENTATISSLRARLASKRASRSAEESVVPEKKAMTVPYSSVTPAKDETFNHPEAKKLEAIGPAGDNSKEEDHSMNKQRISSNSSTHSNEVEGEISPGTDDLFHELPPWASNAVEATAERATSEASNINANTTDVKVTATFQEPMPPESKSPVLQTQNVSQSSGQQTKSCSTSLNLSRKNPFEETMEGPHIQPQTLSNSSRVNDTNKSMSVLDLSKSNLSILVKSASNMSCVDKLANLSLIPEGGPSSIDDFLGLLDIYVSSSLPVRRSTMCPVSLKPVETISEKVQMVTPELEMQMYQWACKQMTESVAKCKENNKELGDILLSNPPEIFLQAVTDQRDSAVARARTLKRIADKKSKRLYKEWRVKMVQGLSKELKSEDSNIGSAHKEITDRLQATEQSLLSMKQFSTKLDSFLLDVDNKIADLQNSIDESLESSNPTARNINLQGEKLQEEIEQLKKEERILADELRRKHSAAETDFVEEDTNHDEDILKNTWIKALTIENLYKCKVREWDSRGATFNFLFESVSLQVSFDGCGDSKKNPQNDCPTVTDFKLISKLSDSASDAAKLCTKLVLLKKISCHTLPQILLETSLASLRADDLFADLIFCDIHHMTKIKGKSVTVVLSNLAAHSKVEFTFHIIPSTFPDDRIQYDVTVHIGNISMSDIDTTITSVKPGYRYLRRLISALNKLIKNQFTH